MSEKEKTFADSAAHDGEAAGRVEEAAPPYGDAQREREQGRAWVRTWEKAGRELERIHSEDLAAMTEDTARQAMLDVFDLWTPPPPEDASQSSGLVEQQRLFVRFQRILEKRAAGA